MDRLRIALRDIYAYYREAEPMLSMVVRDAVAVPLDVRRANEQATASYRDLLLDGALSDRSAIGLMAGLVEAASRTTGRQGSIPSSPPSPPSSPSRSGPADSA